MLTEVVQQFKEVPEYWIALKSALAVLAMGLPLYLGLRYFLYRRHLAISFAATFNFVNVFILFAGLAFILASPLASLIPSAAISTYLFLTCIAASFSVVSLIDVFLLQHYLTNEKKVYVSPPLRTVIKLSVFCVAILPIFRFVLHFNPLALVAIPTIATAGIAFALQDTLKAFIAGVGLGHIIRLGEWIAFQDKEGRVLDINWARTIIETVDGQRVFIPNNLLQTGIFLNYTSGNPVNRQCLKVSASYDIAPARVKETLAKCSVGVPGVSVETIPASFLLEFGDSGIVYGLFYWVDDYMNRTRIQDDLASRVWYAFQREGIVIPYPTRTVHVERPGDRERRSSPHPAPPPSPARGEGTSS